MRYRNPRVVLDATAPGTTFRDLEEAYMGTILGNFCPLQAIRISKQLRDDLSPQLPATATTMFGLPLEVTWPTEPV